MRLFAIALVLLAACGGSTTDSTPADAGVCTPPEETHCAPDPTTHAARESCSVQADGGACCTCN